MECLDEGFDSATTVFYLPYTVQRRVRTSNYIERVNRELKRRSTAIGVFPNGKSIIRLMGTLLIEYHEKYQNINRMFFDPTYLEIVKCKPTLKKIAEEQRHLYAA